MDVHVVCGIAWRDGKVMVARRLETDGALGSWEFPGGKIQRNESATQALIREFKEELDLSIAVLNPVACSVRDQLGRRLCLHAYTVRILEGELKLSVHSEIQWVSPAALTAWKEFSEPDKPFLEWLLRLDPHLIS